MTDKNLSFRTKAFALNVLRFTSSLPHSKVTDVIGKQLLRSATSVGANYRAASRAKSTADFIAKMGIVEEEADESLYWMELLIESGIVPKEQLTDMMAEGNTVVAMTIASIKTARHNKA